MDRLTRYRGDIQKYDLKELYGGVSQELCQKLGKIEDLMGKYQIKDIEMLERMIIRHDNNCMLEEKIGCPLEVVVKLAKQDELYYQFFNELQHHKRIKVDLKNGLVWYCKQVGGHYACSQPLSNYGKTFWLREDKSE